MSRHQQSEWTGTNEPTPHALRRARKWCDKMRKKKIKRYVTTDRGFHFTAKDIRRIVLDVYDAMGPERKTEFMVFAFGVTSYHGKVRDLSGLQPEHFDAVGFAFMEKLIELRKAHA
jgi:hypothetical protein